MLYVSMSLSPRQNGGTKMHFKQRPKQCKTFVRCSSFATGDSAISIVQCSFFHLFLNQELVSFLSGGKISKSLLAPNRKTLPPPAISTKGKKTRPPTKKVNSTLPHLFFAPLFCSDRDTERSSLLPMTKGKRIAVVETSRSLSIVLSNFQILFCSKKCI